MYSKLINSKIIQTEEQIFNQPNMDSKFNNLIDVNEFKRKNKRETEDEFNFRLSIYHSIIERIKLNGDIAITLTLMLINRMKYAVKYNIKYENILDRIENELSV